MLVNEYRLKIQFKKGRKMGNTNNIPMVGSRPLECMSAQNICAERTLHHWSLRFRVQPFLNWLAVYKRNKRLNKLCRSLLS